MPPISAPQSAGNNKQRRTIIIVIVASVLLIVGIVVLAYLLNSGKKATSSNKTTSDGSVSSESGATPVTADELRESFEKVAKTLIHGSPSAKNLDLTTETSRWSLTIISDSTAERQYNFAESIKKANNTYQENLKNYLASNENEELLTRSRTFDDEITSIVLYLEFNKFVSDFNSQYLKTPNEMYSVVENEINSALKTKDRSSVKLITGIASFYENNLQRLQLLSENGCIEDEKLNDTCATELENGATDSSAKFQNLMIFLGDLNGIKEESFNIVKNEIANTIKAVNEDLEKNNE